MADKNCKSNSFSQKEYDREKLLERALDKAKIYKQSSNYFKDELDFLQNSCRFRLGSEIVNSLSSPKRLITLPYRALKILKDKNRNEMARSNNNSIPNKLNSESETIVLDVQDALEQEVHSTKQNKRILYIILDAFGGTTKTNEDLMSYADGLYDVYVLMGRTGALRLFKFSNNRLILLSGYKINDVWNVKNILSDEYRNIYENILKSLSIDLVHIRHLMFHSFDILDICHSMNIPTVVSFHDFYYICPTINLINTDNVYCAGVCRDCDTKCRLPNETQIGDADTASWVNNVWRVEVRKYLNLADKFITTANYPRDLYCKFYPEFKERFKIIEHGRDFYYDRKYCGSYMKNGKIRILVPGNINFYKGSDYIVKLKKCDNDDMLEFHIIGHIENDELMNYVTWHGAYSRDEFDYYVKKIAPDYIGIFSIWPETYCHIITEAWSCGMPCIVTDIGVLKERAEKNGGCILVNLSNPQEAYKKITETSANKDAYDKLCEEALTAEYRSINDMGYEYKKVYDELI